MRDTPRTHTRRVSNTHEEDVWKRIADEAEAESYGADSLGMLERNRKLQQPVKRKKKKMPPKPEAQTRRRDMSPDGMRRRHQKRQQARRRAAARLRAFFALTAAAVVVITLLLVTPWFDIQSISVSGNTLVSAQEVSELIGDIKGTNLFLAKTSTIEKELHTLKYIDGVSVSKSLFPPSVDIAVTEHVPAGYIQAGADMLILDRNLYIIDKAGGDLSTDGLPCVIGVKIKKSNIASTLIPENPDAGEAVKTFLNIMLSCGETINVVSADFTNMSNITFNYSNRITGICGTSLNLDKKLRLFCETVKNEEIGISARGSIDLTTTGKAIWNY